MGKVLFFIVFIFLITAITRYDSFGNRNSAFNDAFGGFVGDLYRYGNNLMHTGL